jgi:hypothetical protein
MDYSTHFVLRAARAAQTRHHGAPWMSLPIGERVARIYDEMQRIEEDASRSRAAKRQEPVETSPDPAARAADGELLTR